MLCAVVEDTEVGLGLDEASPALGAGTREPVVEVALEATASLLHPVQGLEEDADLGLAAFVKSVDMSGWLIHEGDLAVLEAALQEGGNDGLPWRPSLLSRREGCGKQLDDPGNAGVLVVTVGLAGSTAGRGGGGARVGVGAPGASAKSEAVPVVP